MNGGLHTPTSRRGRVGLAWAWILTLVPAWAAEPGRGCSAPLEMRRAALPRREAHCWSFCLAQATPMAQERPRFAPSPALQLEMLLVLGCCLFPSCPRSLPDLCGLFFLIPRFKHHLDLK